MGDEESERTREKRVEGGANHVECRVQRSDDTCMGMQEWPESGAAVEGSSPTRESDSRVEAGAGKGDVAESRPTEGWVPKEGAELPEPISWSPGGVRRQETGPFGL